MSKKIPNKTTAKAIKDARQYVEHQKICRIVIDRENGKTISHDDMLKKLGIDKSELAVAIIINKKISDNSKNAKLELGNK